VSVLALEDYLHSSWFFSLLSGGGIPGGVKCGGHGRGSCSRGFFLPEGFSLLFGRLTPSGVCGQGGGSVICVVGLRSQAHSFGGTSTAKLAGFPLRGVAYVGEGGGQSRVEVWVQGAVLVQLRQPMLRESSSERTTGKGEVPILRMRPPQLVRCSLLLRV
jgi:hypothetical protein